MEPTYFPLRWESTGDHWWFASPIDWAAANGHYDLVRELLRLDGNHLIKLTSLRRIRRLETVWDDEEQFHDVAKCRSHVARQLLIECEAKRGKNSLIRGGYGGWLLYTAASAGDLKFVQELLERDPLIVFGEGEYGVTDIFYAAARSKNYDVFRMVFDFAVSPRFSGGDGKEMEEHVGEIPAAYKEEMMNRAVHTAARGGNLRMLKELLGDCKDVLVYRDVQGATILHAAAGRGQVEVVKDLIASFDIINCVDKYGNTALHVAAYRGQLAVVEALILASPLLISSRNHAGETFLHMAVTGFQTLSFRRLDHQIDLMKRLVSGKIFNIEEIVNARTNDGQTALHLAIIGNIHSDLVELLMTADSIDVNIRDNDGMTPLDTLRRRPRSESSKILTRQLISAGGVFSSQDYSTRKVVASHLKMQISGNSPGTSFRISDAEIFLYTGIENVSIANGSVPLSAYSSEISEHGSTMDTQTPRKSKRMAYLNYAAQRLNSVLHWPKKNRSKTERLKKLIDKNSTRPSKGTPIPLRERYSTPSSLPNNKRTLAARSNLPSPNAKKKLASGAEIPDTIIPHRSPSSSFSKSPFSSHGSLDKQKGIRIENDVVGPSCSSDDGMINLIQEQDSVNKRMMNTDFSFGAPGQTTDASSSGVQAYDLYERSVLSTA